MEGKSFLISSSYPFYQVMIPEDNTWWYRNCIQAPMDFWAEIASERVTQQNFEKKT